MYAVLYSDVAMLDRLMKTGADPNAREHAKATPLLWAATEFEKTRMLLAHGAELNAGSDDMRTPLMVAAGHPGGARIVRLLLDHGANPNPATNPAGAASPLTQAAAAGDAESMQLLLDHGAEVKDAGGIALNLAVAVKCSRCVDLLLKRDFEKEVYTDVLPQAAFLGDLRTARLMLDRGAAVNAVDSSGRTALMSAAVSDLLPLDVVKLLIERGADVNAKSQHPQSGDTGLTVLDIAKLHGETPVVDLLIHSGATGAGRTAAVARPQPAKTVRGAIERSLPLLQRGDAGFSSRSGCISCHNNSLAAMAIGLGRRNGFRVDEQIAAQQVKVNAAYLERQRPSLHQSFFATPAGDQAAESILGPFVLAYVLVGLDAEHYKADLNTDAVAIYLKAHQIPDGHWAFPIAADRPPICSHYAGQTALCMRALQLYAPKVERPEYKKSIAAAAQWLARVESTTNEDRFWRLLGLAWAALDPGTLQQARHEVLALQRPDGGWSDLPSLESNAYATGMALNALHTSGLSPSDPAYKHGVGFLLNTQLEDGSWYVKTRALGGQPYFDAGFPHGVDQFISAAATGWATIALIPASPTDEVKSVSGARD